jgi:ferredoxin
VRLSVARVATTDDQMRLGLIMALLVWIDQDLCTGDGLCTDHCPDVFVLLEDGIAYVKEDGHPSIDEDGVTGTVAVPERQVDAVIAAAIDCPGECIFVEAEPDLVHVSYLRSESTGG